MAIVTPAAVRSHLPGTALSAYLAQWGDAAQQDRALSDRIEAAEAGLRRELQLVFEPRVIKTYPTSPSVGDPDYMPEGGFVKGVDYDYEEEPYDYWPSQYGRWGWLALRRRPLISIEKMRICFGPSMNLFSIPAEWVRKNPRMGSVQFVPTPGQGYTQVLFQTGGLIAPYLQNLAGGSWVPGTFAVDYTAGIPDVETDPDWADLRQCVAQEAAKLTLLSVGESKVPGVANVSLSGDGLSESRSLTKFGDHIQRLQQQIDAYKATFKETETPMFMASI